ncbi:MAG: gliding motility-associated C-terminal domain-containing protein, partial [Flavobacteriales bacterium]|nr:gliding motility-associated C-terminal domain-containing protein [Flavobacteriales bacterium]
VVSPTIFTTYTVVGTDVNGCSNSASVDVAINPLPIIVLSPDTSVCLGDTLNLRGISNLTYVWDNGIGAGANHDVFPTVNTTYTAIGTDANGCSNSDQVNVTILSLPNVVASASSSTICSGNSVNLSASGANIYSWDNGLSLNPSINPNVTATPTITTTYTVTAANTNGCINTSQVTVTVISCVPPVVNLSASDTTVCINNCISFTDLSANTPTSWTWYFFGADTPTDNNQNPTNICYSSVGSFDVALVSSNAFGTDSLFLDNYITVDSCNVPEEITPVVVIPNVFSPNADGQNDLFKVSGIGITNVSITVFNRWGQKVFNTNQLNDGWDGRTNSGTEVPEGTYYFVIEVTTTTSTETKTGYLTLIR